MRVEGRILFSFAVHIPAFFIQLFFKTLFFSSFFRCFFLSFCSFTRLAFVCAIAGILTNYNVLVKGLDSHNTTRIFKNMTIDAGSPTLLLANLSTGVTYYISVAAATKVGAGPFSKPAVLRMDPRTQSLDTGYTRYVCAHVCVC